MNAKGRRCDDLDGAREDSYHANVDSHCQQYPTIGSNDKTEDRLGGKTVRLWAPVRKNLSTDGSHLSEPAADGCRAPPRDSGCVPM